MRACASVGECACMRVCVCVHVQLHGARVNVCVSSKREREREIVFLRGEKVSDKFKTIRRHWTRVAPKMDMTDK